MTPQKRIDEIKKTQEALEKALAKFRQQNPENANFYNLTPFFRFPGGEETVDALEYLRKNNIASFTWEAGANDWLPRMTAAAEVAQAVKELTATKGGIFLVHDVHQTTVDMVPYLLRELTKLGFKIRHMIPKPE